MKSRKFLIVVLAATALIAWILGVLRFDAEWANVLFKILLFPFGFWYLLYESYSVTHLNFSHLFNNEFFQTFIFGMVVFAQGILFYLVSKMLQRKKKIHIVCS